MVPCYISCFSWSKWRYFLNFPFRLYLFCFTGPFLRFNWALLGWSSFCIPYLLFFLKEYWAKKKKRVSGGYDLSSPSSQIAKDNEKQICLVFLISTHEINKSSILVPRIIIIFTTARHVSLSGRNMVSQRLSIRRF